VVRKKRGTASLGFPPLAAQDARVLILGSLPGRMSLAMQQYYAQPYNAFWKIMGTLFGAGPELPYERRVARLLEHRVAVWDVLAAGERPGSWDSAIVRASMIVNDFAGFFAAHRNLRAICCNGGTAFELYRRRVLPTLGPPASDLPTLRLPSTSPAHAALRFEAKLERWAAALRGVARD
jgi:hypoxanthine-DNA glycosylase